MKKDKLLQMRIDIEFFEKLEYLRRINGYRTASETIRKIIEKEFRKETINDESRGNGTEK